MDNVMSMDIETCSVVQTGGRCMPYAVGWCYNTDYSVRVAETESELTRGTMLWEAVQTWSELAQGQKLFMSTSALVLSLKLLPSSTLPFLIPENQSKTCFVQMVNLSVLPGKT